MIKKQTINSVTFILLSIEFTDLQLEVSNPESSFQKVLRVIGMDTSLEDLVWRQSGAMDGILDYLGIHTRSRPVTNSLCDLCQIVHFFWVEDLSVKLMHRIR